MSGLDQPIVIANASYHTGHERSWLAAVDQGFATEEGLERHVYLRGGLIPAEWEAQALGRVMWERGVDISPSVNVWSAIAQRARGEDVYIVAGWRVQSAPKLIAAKGITRPEQLRGARSIIRERWGMHIGVVNTLQSFGVGPNDIDWVEDPMVAYGAGGADDLLRSGEITLLSANGPRAEKLIDEGFPLVLDLAEFYVENGGWPPGRIVAATRRTIEERGDELRAFLRASLRGFWFSQDPANHAYMHELETRCRAETFNEDERAVRRLRNVEESPHAREDSRDMGGSMVMDGLVPRPALAAVIQGMVHAGQIDHAIEVDDVLKDAASIDACQQLLERGLIDREKLERWRRAKGVQVAATR
jgi:ABC-type nitrate/sulfonate/bicarbonate transport system substrate-binding protein